MLKTASFTIHLTPPPLSASHLRESESRTLRTITNGLLISLCLHGLLFFFLPNHDITQGAPPSGDKGPLVVRLNPPSAPPPSSQIVAPQKLEARVTPPVTLPPQMMTRPSATLQSAPLVRETPTPVRPSEAAPPDLMSMINTKREQRAAAEAAARTDGRASGQAPSADDVAMAKLKRNLSTLSQKDGTSGVFQILSKGHRSAQFSFNGWTGDRSNSRRDVIEVDAGLGGNIEIAIIRRMIELIRTHYKGDFNWESRRVGRVVVLSARVEDSAGLEEFMMREFF